MTNFAKDLQINYVYRHVPVEFCHALTRDQFHNNLIQNISGQIIHFLEKIIKYIKSRIYSFLCTYVHKHEMYLPEQRSKSFEIWSAII